MKFYRRPWLPLTLPELAVWFNNFASQLAKIAADFGITPAQLTTVNQDRDTVQWLANAQEAFDATGGSLRSFRDNTLYGEKGDADPIAPGFEMPEPPAQFSTRIIERLLDLVEDVLDADIYTPEIGALLGIVVPKTDPLAPEDWTTTLKGKVLPDMQLEIDWVMGEADGICLQFQYVGEETWNTGGNYPKRPAILSIPPKTPNTPQAVRIRGRLLKGNSPVGQYSPEINLVAAP